MPCTEFVKAIEWSKKTTAAEIFPVMAYFTKHLGYGGLTPPSPTTQHRDAVHYASGEVRHYHTPTSHLKGTLKGATNTEDPGVMKAAPRLTYDVEIFPDGTLSYLQKLDGKAIAGMAPTKVQATCVNNVLLTAIDGSQVVAVGVARKPSIPQPS